MTDAWVLHAARGPRRAEDALEDAPGVARHALAGPDDPARSVQALFAPEARPLALIAGLPVATPAHDAPTGLAALLHATHAVGGGFLRDALVGAVTAHVPPPVVPLAPAAAWRLERPTAPVAAARLAARLGLSEEDRQQAIAARMDRAAAAAPRPHLQGGGDAVDPQGTPGHPAHCAAFLRLVSSEALADAPLPARARVAAVAAAAVDPADPLLALAEAARAALARAGLGASDLHAVVVAAADVAVALHVQAALGLPDERVDPEGGPVARGAAGAAGGLAEVVDLLDHLDDRGARYGLVVEAAPWGRATAVILDREVWA